MWAWPPAQHFQTAPAVTSGSPHPVRQRLLLPFHSEDAETLKDWPPVTRLGCDPLCPPLLLSFFSP
jgi:hypothetical protein